MLSDFVDIISGVTPGLALGPLLFPMSICETPELLSYRIAMFANGTKSYAIIRNLGSGHSDLKFVSWMSHASHACFGRKFSEILVSMLNLLMMHSKKQIQAEDEAYEESYGTARHFQTWALSKPMF